MLSKRSWHSTPTGSTIFVFQSIIMVYTKFYSLIHIAILLLWSGVDLVGQKQSSINELASALHQALINRNEIQLDKLLHEDLSYGHSNGWVEHKSELLNNNRTKYLIYEHITMDSLTITKFKNISILRFKAVYDIVFNGKNISIPLHVCQIWVKTKRTWKLLARQSTKLG